MKIFNNYKIVSVAFAATLTMALTSCHKDIFEEPLTSLSPGAAFESADRVEKSAIGMYDQLQNPNYLGGRVLIYNDCRGNDVNVASFFAPLPTFTTVLADNSLTLGAWQGAYRTIGEANLFLKNLAGATSVVTPAKASQYTGEAKFIRAVTYFYLVNLFAQPYGFSSGATHLGVPLVLTSSDTPFSDANQVSRATVAAVYSQMENDLLDAENLLPVDYGDPGFSNVARATKGAAQAMLSRLYLYKNDYVNANKYADKVIATNKYGLNSDPLTTFRTYTTKESIFSVAHNGGDNPNTNNALGQHYSPSKRGDITVSNDYVGLMDPADLRFKNLILLQGGSYWSLKYIGVTDWVPVIRYAEVLLNKAEALANMAPGTTADATAIGLIGQIRTRSSAPAITAPTTKADLIVAVLKERKIELAFEGQGESDFLRTGRGIPAHSTAAAQAYGSNYVILPIPLYDTQKNTNLVQNPGY